jgi:hypothetical protein
VQKLDVPPSHQDRKLKRLRESYASENDNVGRSSPFELLRIFHRLLQDARRFWPRVPATAVPFPTNDVCHFNDELMIPSAPRGKSVQIHSMKLSLEICCDGMRP